MHVRVSAAALMVAACADARPARRAPAQASGEAAFRAMFKEMVETDTSAATGDCTALANKTAARMKASGFPPISSTSRRRPPAGWEPCRCACQARTSRRRRS